MLKGDITDKRLFLNLVTAKDNLSVKELLLLLTDTDTFQGLEYIPKEIFPELKVDEIKLNVLVGEMLNAQALVATSVGEDSDIGNDIILEKTLCLVYSDSSAGRMNITPRACMSVYLPK